MRRGRPGFTEGRFPGRRHVRPRISRLAGEATGWSAPAAVRIEGGSFGFQLGGSATDLVMLVMNRRGMERLLGDKFTIGGDAAAAAGPVGRETIAQTDVLMRAEILSWSRSRGLFAGISLDGATLRPDSSENRKLYGRQIGNREILEGGVATPHEAQLLVSELALIARAEVPGTGSGGERSAIAPAQPATTEVTASACRRSGNTGSGDDAAACSRTAVRQAASSDQAPPQLPANKPLAAATPPSPPPSQSASAQPIQAPPADEFAAAQPTQAPLPDESASAQPTISVQDSSGTQANSIPIALLYEIALGVLVVAVGASILLSRRSRLARMVSASPEPPPVPAAVPVPPPLPPIAESAPSQVAEPRPTA